MKIKDSSQSNQKPNNLIAQEISFAKVLAGNDKKLRDRAVKKLIKWLAVRSKGKTAFTEENFQRIWSGLFYCMWMSDKFLIQEELAESISKLVHCFNSNTESALLFIKCFYKIMSLEWPGIDQHRIDKFNMLIRRFLRQSLEYCNRKDWDENLVKRLTAVFEDTVLNAEVPNGYLLHFVDIFLEELSKVTKGKVKHEVILIFLEPFIKLIATSLDSRTQNAMSSFFNYLIRQTDIGIEYEAKLNAWKEMEMPCETPEELELCIENAAEEENENQDSELDEVMEETALDPRAGKVDTILPQIPTDFDGILALIKKYQNNNNSVTSCGKRHLRHLEGKFRTLKKGKMPENIRKPKILLDIKKKRRHTAKCVKELMEFSKKLDEDKNLDLICDEIVSDDELNDYDNSLSSEENNLKTENSIQVLSSPVAKAEELKLVEKRKEKLKSLKTIGKENERDTNEVKKTKINKNNTDKTKSKEKKNQEIPKSKSLKKSFKVEDVDEGSDSFVITPKRKRKSSVWEVSDLDDEVDKKINVPEIIKLETKKKRSLPKEIKKNVKSVYCDTPTINETPQLKLTASFWNKAKEKAVKKKGTNVPNPVFFDQSKNPKRISFALDRNEAQENDEYLKEVRNSPSIPFDGTRKPIQSALKSGLSPSPINPFYRFKKFQ